MYKKYFQLNQNLLQFNKKDKKKKKKFQRDYSAVFSADFTQVLLIVYHREAGKQPKITTTKKNVEKNKKKDMLIRTFC